MPNRKRDSKGRFKDAAFFDTIRDRPGASAAVIAGAAGVAAAGAFLWTRRGQVGEMISSGMDRLSELKAERYDQVDAHLSGPALSRQLRELCAEARASSEG